MVYVRLGKYSTNLPLLLLHKTVLVQPWDIQEENAPALAVLVAFHKTHCILSMYSIYCDNSLNEPAADNESS